MRRRITMSKQTGAHTHEEKGKNVPVILFFTGLALFFIGLFLGNMLLVKNILFSLAAILAGYHIIGEGFGDTYRDTKNNRKFSPNIHLLMTLAAVGSAFMGSFEESALLILIFAAAHFLEDYAQGKSQREITKLLNLNPTEARLITDDGSIQTVSVEQLKIGDRVQVLNGAQIPTDGVVIEGSTAVDESSINGESIPKEKNSGDPVFGSTMNGSGTIVVEVTKDSSETVFAKIVQLVNQSQENQSEIASKIKRFEPKYVTLVLAVFPLIVLGGAFLSNLAEVKALAFDKTGTLTKGKPEVTDYLFVDGLEDRQDELVAVLTNMEKKSNHPLATAIVNRFEAETTALNLEVENIVGVGLVTTIADTTFRIGKPSSFEQVPTIIEKQTTKLASEGKTVVYFAENEQVIGLVALMDVPNEEAMNAIHYFKSQNIETTMITGDAKLTGEAVGRLVGVDQVFANVLPEEKSAIVDQLKREVGMTGMVGDGINDAPALVNADIGVAMGDGTDIAIDVADVVVMKNDLSKLGYAHRVSKRLNKIVQQNIIFSMLVVATLIILNFLGIANIAFSVLIHEGSTLVVIFNGLRLLVNTK